MTTKIRATQLKMTTQAERKNAKRKATRRRPAAKPLADALKDAPALSSPARQAVADEWRDWGVAMLQPKMHFPTARENSMELNRLRSIVQGTAKALGVGYECQTVEDEDGRYLVAFVK